MNKLSKIKVTFNRDNLKNLYKNLKKGAQIVTLGAGITAATMLFTGCDQPAGSTTQEQILPTPNNTQMPVYGDEPYDEALGYHNNYTIHNFIGENTKFSSEENYIDAINYYAKKAETYVKGLAANFDNSLKNRPNTRNYFANLTNSIKKIDTFYSVNNPDGQEFDHAVNTIDTSLQPYFKEIIKNLLTVNQRNAFTYCYRILANEGLGTYLNQDNLQINDYNKEKELIISLARSNLYFDDIDFTKYGSNDFFEDITVLLNTIIPTAVKNINNNQDVNLKFGDLKSVINLGIMTNSLIGMHEVIKKYIGHTQCDLHTGIVSTMNDTIQEIENSKQNRTMGL